MCTVPNSDGKRLAQMFGSRDPNKIIEALSEWNIKMAERTLDALDMEAPEKSALDPTINTALKNVFDNGIKLAKLVDPTLGEKKGGGTTVNVGINMTGGRPQVSSHRVDQSDTRELAATVIAELEAEGYNRAAITEDMVKKKLQEYVIRDAGPTYGMKSLETEDAEVIEDD